MAPNVSAVSGSDSLHVLRTSLAVPDQTTEKDIRIPNGIFYNQVKQIRLTPSNRRGRNGGRTVPWTDSTR